MNMFTFIGPEPPQTNTEKDKTDVKGEDTQRNREETTYQEKCTLRVKIEKSAGYYLNADGIFTFENHPEFERLVGMYVFQS